MPTTRTVTDNEALEAFLLEHGPFKERDLIALNALAALAAEGGNKTHAAKRTGLTRVTFRIRLHWAKMMLVKD